jgi:hypothetical protein
LIINLIINISNFFLASICFLNRQFNIFLQFAISIVVNRRWSGFFLFIVGSRFSRLISFLFRRSFIRLLLRQFFAVDSINFDINNLQFNCLFWSLLAIGRCFLEGLNFLLFEISFREILINENFQFNFIFRYRRRIRIQFINLFFNFSNLANRKLNRKRSLLNLNTGCDNGNW